MLNGWRIDNSWVMNRMGRIPAHPTRLRVLGVLGGESFPFDGGGGFGGDVVDDAVDAADFVDDAIGDHA